MPAKNCFASLPNSIKHPPLVVAGILRQVLECRFKLASQLPKAHPTALGIETIRIVLKILELPPGVRELSVPGFA